MAKRSAHKAQHFVPQCYLRAWCDPTKPKWQDPYVWRFNADGSNPRRRSPKNIFHETDLYTIKGADGERDLRLEHGLSGLEAAFVEIRDKRLELRQAFTSAEHSLLCAFVAATHERTPSRRDFLAGQWQSMLDMMDRMKAWAETATPEQRRAASLASGPPAPGRPTLEYEDVKRMAEQPMQTLMPTLVRTVTPLLRHLNWVVLTTDTDPGFITSDAPCVWFDAEAYKRPPFYQHAALIYKSIEISLPVSPRQLLLLHRRTFTGYVDVLEQHVDEFNRRTRFNCDKHFVSRSNTTKPIWFDPGLEPEDSWRKLHPQPEPPPPVAP